MKFFLRTYVSDPTMLVPPGPVLFLPGWQLLLPEYCTLNLGLRFWDCTDIPCLSEDRFFFSVLLQTERCFGVGDGGACPHGLPPRVQIIVCFSVLFVPHLGFTSQPSWLGWDGKITMLPSAVSSPWPYHLCPLMWSFESLSQPPQSRGLV